MNKIYAKTPIRNKYKIILIALFLISIPITLTIIGIVKNPKHEQGVIKTIDKNDIDASSNKTNKTNNNASENKFISDDGVANEDSLAKPFGTFVSNHKPGQNGSNLLILSQCVTSPGASCQIEFKKDDVVRKLSDKKVDATGTATWNWKVDEADLSKGSWAISAIARKNGQTRITTDVISLEIIQ